jgi:hypothetical protein
MICAENAWERTSLAASGVKSRDVAPKPLDARERWVRRGEAWSVSCKLRMRVGWSVPLGYVGRQ